MSKKSERFIPSLAFVCALAFVIAQGCANPNIKMPDALPPIVKQYKHTTVSGGRPGMQNTGVYLEVGDAYSILATGSIDFWPRATAHPVHKPPPGFAYHDVRPELGWPLMVRIGDDFASNPFYSRNGISRVSAQSGHIYLGYRSGKMTASGEPLFPDYYRKDRTADQRIEKRSRADRQTRSTALARGTTTNGSFCQRR